MYLPALSREKSAPYGVKGNVLAPGPWQSGKKLGIGKNSMINFTFVDPMFHKNLTRRLSLCSSEGPTAKKLP